MKDIISYDDFAKLDLQIGQVIEAEKVTGSDKLLCLKVSLGEANRQIIAGIGKKYAPDDIVGKQIIIVTNLETKTLMGLDSEGMLLVAEGDDGPIILIPDSPTQDGAWIH